MINKLIEKYKSKIKDTQQDMYKNEIPLDFTEGFDESINPEEYTCYPIELWEEIIQDLEKLKEEYENNLNDDVNDVVNNFLYNTYCKKDEKPTKLRELQVGKIKITEMSNGETWYTSLGVDTDE